ncbi:MAG: PD-(D/E)XK motif protein, partial [Proteobacteria bacterium]|nr:PD-(D/E)XK motif protein [Candidatus Avisuccinivibrio stercorigallinarum]
MAKLDDKLLKIWHEIEQEKSWGGCRFIHSYLDVSWYAGCPHQGVKSAWIAAPERPQSLPQSKAVSIVRDVFNGRPALRASLTDGDEDVFAALWADLIKYSCGGSSTDEVLKRFAARYKTWVKLLMLKKKAKLTKEEQKGLLGELCFLSSELEKGRSALSAVSGWVGPEGADQDFCWAEGWHEIKAAAFGSDHISISSLQQLSAAGDGCLVVYFIDPAAPERSDAVTLPDMVDKLK